uniref:Uncharacterized protein n=1 Tax=Thermosporothrix sp. COM3 TaxID=2490863 RepID=A0A455SS15_9CHLR|nr:hypothetical protein KTC_52410 [Thermosporothrix sp. COM3]
MDVASRHNAVSLYCSTQNPDLYPNRVVYRVSDMRDDARRSGTMFVLSINGGEKYVLVHFI